MTPDVLRQGWRIAATHALPGALAAVPVDLTDSSTARTFLELVSEQRLTGFAVSAVASGDVALAPAALDELLDRHEQQLALDVRLERLLCEASAVLRAAGIEYRALKGPLLAHTVYRDPSLRSFGDVDLLIPGDRFDDAVGALGALGFGRRFMEPRLGFDARFSKGACVERGDGMEIDLHRTLAPGAFGVKLGRTDFFARAPQAFVVGGQQIAGLDRELAFVHACFHAALGNDPPRLVPLRDVAELLRVGFDDAEVIQLAHDVHCETVIQRALALVERELGLDLDAGIADWARLHQPSRFDRWALRTYSSSQRSYGGQVAVSLWAMQSFRERVAYASALAFPARDYVRARERGYGRRLRHGVHLVSQWRPR
jgi:hypothetical protein